MVSRSDVEKLRAEYAAQKAENKALRSKVIAANLAGNESCSGEEATSQVAILTREQQVLMAGLRLGEELVALRKSNEALFRRGWQLHHERFSLELACAKQSVQAQGTGITSASSPPKSPVSTVLTTDVKASQPATKIASAQAGSIPQLSEPQQRSVQQTDSQVQAPKKCTPEEKAERRELVASLLKAGLNQDVLTINAMRSNAVQQPASVPRVPLGAASQEKSMQYGSPEEAESRGRTREASSQERHASGARIRESSHSAAVAECKYVRELAIRDMLQSISRTPRS